jgi:hypothetical protein
MGSRPIDAFTVSHVARMSPIGTTLPDWGQGWPVREQYNIQCAGETGKE